VWCTIQHAGIGIVVETTLANGESAGALQGETWSSAFLGHGVDPLTEEEERKRLLLERFQAEVGGPILCRALFLVMPGSVLSDRANRSHNGEALEHACGSAPALGHS